MIQSIKSRLATLEGCFKRVTSGIFHVKLKNGSTQDMLWTEAAIKAIDGELEEVSGDPADSNLIGLVNALKE